MSMAVSKRGRRLGIKGTARADTSAVFDRRTDQQDQVARIGTAALIETLLAGLLSDHT